MTVEYEEKLLKQLTAFALIVLITASFTIKMVFLKLIIVLLALIILTVLHFRKYKRDKREGKDLSKYKIWLFIIAMSYLILLVSMFLPYFE